MTEYNPTVWMIRNDGKEIPVPQHINGNPNKPSETMYAAEWLYKNTALPATRKLVLRFIGAFALWKKVPGETPTQALVGQIRDQSYLFLSESFLLEHCDEIPYNDSDVHALNREVINALDREFMRARYGGLHESVPGCRDMYFLISFGHLDWMEIIQDFLLKHRHRINTVTVMRYTKGEEYPTYFSDKNCLELDHQWIKKVLDDRHRTRSEEVDKIVGDMEFYLTNTWSEEYFSVDIFKTFIIPAYDYIRKHMLRGTILPKDIKLVRELCKYTSGFPAIEHLREIGIKVDDKLLNQICDDEVKVCREVAKGMLDLIESVGTSRSACKSDRRLLWVEYEVYEISPSKIIDLDDLENEVHCLVEEKRRLEDVLRKEDEEAAADETNCDQAGDQ